MNALEWLDMLQGLSSTNLSKRLPSYSVAFQRPSTARYVPRSQLYQSFEASAILLAGFLAVVDTVAFQWSSARMLGNEGQS
jgi:hypothetical protein